MAYPDDEILASSATWSCSRPGLVPLAEWRPDGEEDPRQTATYHTIVGGVARKA